jgi:hypothetical protein
METDNVQVEPKKVRSYKQLFLLTLLLLIVVSVTVYFSINSTLKIQKSFDQEQSRADSLQSLYQNSSDSLQHFLPYVTLYSAINVRDEAVKQLKYQVGDVVYCKPDSTKSVITDVIIGGSKYNYYIKYKINDTTIIIPEQLY